MAYCTLHTVPFQVKGGRLVYTKCSELIWVRFSFWILKFISSLCPVPESALHWHAFQDAHQVPSSEGTTRWLGQQQKRTRASTRASNSVGKCSGYTYMLNHFQEELMPCIVPCKCWSPVRTLLVEPLWCGDLGFILNSHGNKAAVNLCPKKMVAKENQLQCLTISKLSWLEMVY